jgi:NitT/TauT family transport system substrate-binding protein
LLRRTVIKAAAGAALTACSPAPPKPAGGRTRLRFATDWRAQAEHGGFYQAVADGLYADGGLDVSIVQGGPSVNVPQLVAAGAVELGLGSSSFMALNMVRAGAPGKAVMACFQKDPQVLICHPRDDISALADMKGKPILLSDAALGATWPWLKARFGFVDDQVRKYTYSLAPFLADRSLIQQGYVTSEPFALAKAMPVPPEVYLLADEGYPPYAALVLAGERLIADNPQAVGAFVAATREGWRRYLNEDAAAADALILTDNPDMTPQLLADARGALKARGLLDSGDAAAGGIGAMSEVRWRDFHATMSGLGIYPDDLDWRAGFTLDFLKA